MYFSRVELKRLCEIFTRMFADPHSKVRSQRLVSLSYFTMCAHLTLFRDECFVFLPLPSAGGKLAFINLLDFYLFYNEGLCLSLSYFARNWLLRASQEAA